MWLNKHSLINIYKVKLFCNSRNYAHTHTYRCVYGIYIYFIYAQIYEGVYYIHTHIISLYNYAFQPSEETIINYYVDIGSCLL